MGILKPFLISFTCLNCILAVEDFLVSSSDPLRFGQELTVLVQESATLPLDFKVANYSRPYFNRIKHAKQTLEILVCLKSDQCLSFEVLIITQMELVECPTP